MSLPKPRGEIARELLAAFVEDVKSSGFVDAALTRHGIEGVLVAPAA